MNVSIEVGTQFHMKTWSQFHPVDFKYLLYQINEGPSFKIFLYAFTWTIKFVFHFYKPCVVGMCLRIRITLDFVFGLWTLCIVTKAMAIRRHQTFLLRGKGRRCRGHSIIKPKSLLCNQDISNNLYWTPSRSDDGSGFEIDWFHFALWYFLLKVIVCVFRSVDESSLAESGHDFSISVSLGGSVRWSVSSLRLKNDVRIDITNGLMW